LEQCLKEVIDYTNEMGSGTLQCSADAVDALKQISDFSLLEKHTCYDVTMECIQQMLKQMVSTSLIMYDDVDDDDDDNNDDGGHSSSSNSCKLYYYRYRIIITYKPKMAWKEVR